MRITRYTVAILVATGGLIVGSATTEAASGHHIDAYALRLQDQAKRLSREVKYHYRHAPQFGHLLADARQVQRKAAHVHQVAHRRGDLEHLQADLQDLDRALHHLDQLMKEIEHPVCDYHDRRARYFHGDTRLARRLVDRMLDTLHHLQEDVRVALRRHRHPRGHRYGRGHVADRGYYHGQTGWYGVSFGNRGWTLRLGSGF
ncbi:MAG: hypothetical protein GTO53_07550 [Planctomycetales bacterium]|nr:hypothetical protein [Planctomycetales bacterium]NIM08991.1 hypothetical protein [Planctomycetales bacterium]NIN08454.1 hypothetical protein [Planctomycetales bacterium]NIN77588.1 hypothetical protein [Planctomycetales bacterium]NIO34753.1 hypothetical protein [Planctomycetales bacterium]